ncbi:hypothetical protein [Nonomuraea sp. NPDC005650]|uniref:hypothetical protein n=1 Tax=Nonomuraea sp. NPDC005650 TaxID=3157045 RepID=UPI0033AEFC3A
MAEELSAAHGVSTIAWSLPDPRPLHGGVVRDGLRAPAMILGGDNSCVTGICQSDDADNEDPRIKAGLSLDGPVAGPVVTAGLDRPYLLMEATKARPRTSRIWPRSGRT